MLNNDQLKTKINELIAYACDNLALKPEDEYYTLNNLLDFFHCDAPGEPINDYADFQTTIIDPIIEYAIANNMTDEDHRLLFETKLLGLVTPPPSLIIEQFDNIVANKSVEEATTWLFDISKASNYVRMPDINKNIKWEHKGKFGKIGITINLSKPEKDPKQIALAKLQPKSGYPACMLCSTNVGFAGNLNHPARQTLRIIPIELHNEMWQLQFSPYQYYDQHVIALAEEHRPMMVCDDAFARLLDFVDLFPHYFIGSNAALPIVGGSILTHDHYQGGSKVLPMFKVGARKHYSSPKFSSVDICIADWYNSVVRISGKNRQEVFTIACNVLDKWSTWSDESVGIISKTTEQHNAITPIVRLDKNEYVFDLILRNNRTDEAHPFGIFHPEERLHNIKKEGIGIIEVMGLFILPGRLKIELENIKEYLTGEKAYDAQELSNPENSMHKHANLIAQLIKAHGVANKAPAATKLVTNYVNKACEKILECTGVFKNDEKGTFAFDKFMKEGIGFRD